MAQGVNSSGGGEQPSLTWAGKLLIGLFVVACLAGAWWVAHKRGVLPASVDGRVPSLGLGGGPAVTVGIAYGTEKERWLKGAVEEFKKTPEGKNITVLLIPMGSLEGAHAALAGDARINVWSPASGVYKDQFIEDWTGKYGKTPILKEEALALTPMVFVMWEERYQAFQAKYGRVDFDTVNRALHEPGGWNAIAKRPEWGLFKFGHTNPGESNSGMQALLLAGHSYFKQTGDLSLGQVTDPAFGTWLGRLEAATTSDSNSTGNLMREMVLKGPSTFDALLVYESVAIDYLRNAEGRWGPVHVVYPEYNSWNESPYYILDATWSSAEQRKAAQTFLDFMLTEGVQRDSMVHGFRPAEASVSMKGADSPWVRYGANGVKLDLEKICAEPKAEVVANLLAGWQRRERQ